MKNSVLFTLEETAFTILTLLNQSFIPNVGETLFIKIEDDNKTYLVKERVFWYTKKGLIVYIMIEPKE